MKIIQPRRSAPMSRGASCSCSTSDRTVKSRAARSPGPAARPRSNSTTCRIMRARARFIPATIPRAIRPWTPMPGRSTGGSIAKSTSRSSRSSSSRRCAPTSAGVLSCWSASNGEQAEAKPCPPGESGPQLARLARASRMPLSLSTVTVLTPAGATELADRTARGDLYRASEALLTIAADGSILECRDTSGQFFGGGNSGVPPSPCIDWFPTRKLYESAVRGRTAPNREGHGPRLCEARIPEADTMISTIAMTTMLAMAEAPPRPVPAPAPPPMIRTVPPPILYAPPAPPPPPLRSYPGPRRRRRRRRRPVPLFGAGAGEGQSRQPDRRGRLSGRGDPQPRGGRDRLPARSSDPMAGSRTARSSSRARRSPSIPRPAGC